ncbi:hypothetical protein FB567DRAFT_607965 [Paraphoma chrysanthemicola]|uniref:Uncharacterized protein n=1 Tax=Paraphoma chrysanthemicola TaxID=798071 RepID=A0A8K0QXQ2_9PLEO|nr:hypothetical protein FB567DRAFT_607965 [Paraphoma chrysanthemicola]
MSGNRHPSHCFESPEWRRAPTLQTSKRRTTAPRAVTLRSAAHHPLAGLLHAHVSHAGSSSAFWHPTGAIATASAARTVAPSFQNGANRHPCACTGPNCYQCPTTLASPSHDARERCGLATQRRASLSVLPYRASCSRSGLQVVAGHGRGHHIARSPVHSQPLHRHWPTAAASLQRCPTSSIRACSLAVNAVTRLTPSILLELYRHTARAGPLSRNQLTVPQRPPGSQLTSTRTHLIQ